MNEIVCRAYPVKYHGIDYHEGYIILEQNRTRRSIPDGYYFEDTGVHLYVSSFYSCHFQCGRQPKLFYLDKDTKKWRDYSETVVERHRPDKEKEVKDNIIEQLKK